MNEESGGGKFSLVNSAAFETGNLTPFSAILTREYHDRPEAEEDDEPVEEKER